MFSADVSQSSHRWYVVRMGAGSRTEVVLLSRKFFALTTHWNSCTVPCCGDECRLCDTLPARGLFYVAVVCNSRVMLLELGAQSSSHFEQHAKMLHGGMKPGLVFSLSRTGPKSPIRSEVIRFQEDAKEVDQIVLAARTMALYKFPCPNPDEEIESYEKRCRKVAKVRCDRAADLIDNARDRRVN